MAVLHLATRAGRFLLTRLGLRLRVRGDFLGDIRCPGLAEVAPVRAVTDRATLRAIGDRAPGRSLAIAGYPRGIKRRAPYRSLRLRVRGDFLGDIRCPGLAEVAPVRAVTDRAALRAIGDRAPGRSLAIARYPRGIEGRAPHRSIRLCR